MAENEQARPEADDAELMQQLREELKNLTVSDHLLFMMQSLSSLAVERMGLAEEAGGRRDLDEARLAIDAFKALLELVAKAQPGEDMRAHRDVLSQLQMTYLGILDHGGAEGAPAEATPDSSQGPAEAPPEAADNAEAGAPPEPATDAEAGAPPEPATDAEAGGMPEAAPDGRADAPAEASSDEPADVSTESTPGSEAQAPERED